MSRTQCHCLTLLGVLPLLGFTLVASGCQILFWTNLTQAGLPCREPDATDPRVCLVGYTCIDGFCQPAEAKNEDDPCVADEECADGLVCRDHYLNSNGECDAKEYDRVCDSGDSSLDGALFGGLKCRRVCDPSQAIDQQCNDGQTCFDDDVPTVDGYCQAGNCSNDTECGGDALCLLKDQNPDDNDVSGSGLCFERCDPFGCNPTTGCNGCPTTDDLDSDGNAEVMGCEPRDGSFSRIVCVRGGSGGVGNTCQVESDDCQPGTFCLEGACTRWCNSTGAAPACDVGQVCNIIPNSAVANLGFCSN